MVIGPSQLTGCENWEDKVVVEGTSRLRAAR